MPSKKRRSNGEGTIYHNGTYWVAQLTLTPHPQTGKPRRKSYYCTTRKQALETLTSARYRLQTSTPLNTAPLTLAQWSSLWMETYKKNTLSPTTYAKYQSQISSHILPNLGAISLDNLSPLAVQQFINHLSASNLSDSYVSLIFARLNAMCKKALQLEMLRKNPCESAALPRTHQPKQINPLTKDQQTRLMDTCKTAPDSFLYLFLLATGCRIGEALALTWQDVNFETSRLLIHKTAVELNGKAQISPSAKTRSGNRAIPITANLKNLLNQIRQHQTIAPNKSNLIFPSKTGCIRHSSNVRKHFKKVCQAAQIPPVNLHALRHTFATRALENGVNIKLLSSILGHKDITVTLNTYAHVLDEYQDASLNILNTIF